MQLSLNRTDQTRVPSPLFLGAALLPVAAFAYSLIEARLHRVKRYRLNVLPSGAAPLRLLQVSDLHLRTRTRRLARFVESLADVEYDLVLATGDLLGEADAMPKCAEILNGLRGRLGRFFVLGSSDYYAPIFKNYFDYFRGKRRLGTRRNRTAEFIEKLTSTGWTDLDNKNMVIDLNGMKTQMTGLDDPYLHRDDRTLLKREPGVDFAICVTHDPAPYRDAARNDYDLIVGGHTHGGQVRLPLVGALVTNSSLPRGLAKGLHRVDRSWLFVNPGLGTGKYAPFRFLCPPEASVLELHPPDEP
jgi:predicted MPP superfamily phosphohydrolase